MHMCVVCAHGCMCVAVYVCVGACVCVIYVYEHVCIYCHIDFGQ